MNYETENYHDQLIQFNYEGTDYNWVGDYTIEHTGEDESEFAPAYGEMEIRIDHTTSLCYYDEEQDLFIEVKPTTSILMEIELEIERNY